MDYAVVYYMLNGVAIVLLEGLHDELESMLDILRKSINENVILKVVETEAYEILKGNVVEVTRLLEGEND